MEIRLLSSSIDGQEKPIGVWHVARTAIRAPFEFIDVGAAIPISHPISHPPAPPDLVISCQAIQARADPRIIFTAVALNRHPLEMLSFAVIRRAPKPVKTSHRMVSKVFICFRFELMATHSQPVQILAEFTGINAACSHTVFIVCGVTDRENDE
jgi:hypothetical protein